MYATNDKPQKAMCYILLGPFTEGKNASSGKMTVGLNLNMEQIYIRVVFLYFQRPNSQFCQKILQTDSFKETISPNWEDKCFPLFTEGTCVHLCACTYMHCVDTSESALM